MRDAWNQPHGGFSVAFDLLNETEIVFVNAAFDSNPLVLLESLLLKDLAALHDFSHLVDGDHLDGSMVDAREPLKNLFDMLGLVCFTVNNSLTQLAFEHLEDVERVSKVQILNQLVGDFEHELSFTAWSNFDTPQFRVFDRWKADISGDVFDVGICSVVAQHVFVGLELCFSRLFFLFWLILVFLEHIVQHAGIESLSLGFQEFLRVTLNL